MDSSKPIRLSKLARELNVGTSTIVEFLQKKGIEIENNPNSKVPNECMDILINEFSDSKQLKEKSKEVTQRIKQRKEAVSAEKSADNQEKPQPKEDGKELSIVDSSISNTKQEDKTPKTDKEDTEKTKTSETSKTIETEEGHKPEEKKSDQIKVLGKVDLDSLNQKTRPKKKTKKEIEEEKKAKKETTKLLADKQKADVEKEAKKEKEKQEKEKQEKEKDAAKIKEEPKEDFIQTEFEKLTGPSVVGRINIDDYLKKEEEIKKKREQDKIDRKKERQLEKAKAKTKRKRIRKDNVKVDVDKPRPASTDKGKKRRPKAQPKPEISNDQVQKQIKETYARLTADKQKSKTSKYRREKRDQVSQKMQDKIDKQEAEKNILSITEFVSVNEIARMMNVPVNEVIATCMNLGLFVSINQRLDAETMSLVADEFGYKVEFVSVEDIEDTTVEFEEDEENLEPRAPIVTVMGHVDHGKTKLLDYIRHSNVVAGEAGGITQHIGAYSVELENNKRICFLDTPGHEAFTAMRARGAQVTDAAIIVVAADDDVMPQTIEAINHASAAGVPIVFAINKIDKPTANPDKIKEKLAAMNYMVEEWGGKYQSQDISAIKGQNIDELLEKVLLEAELLDLKANPNRPATGTVIESMLDKGRGYVATLLVQAGTLKVGDIMLAGTHTGRVKAMYNERGQKIDEAGPSTPAQVLGLNGAPQAGDKFSVMQSEHEAKSIATKRSQLQREVGLRTQKYITLDEIGRRLALGNFHEVNVIVKGDFDGSVEALSDSLEKLSNDEVQVVIKHKAVGQISESDVMLAAASDAIIIGFQVRPSLSARKLAEKEKIDIRLYSIIYDAINDVRDALEGLLSPEIKERIVGSAVVLQTFKIDKVGTVAGCQVVDGKIYKTSKVRVIRDGIVIYTANLGSLKRFQEDAKEVVSGQECGLNIENFNDVKVDDVIEAFEEFEIKKKL
jgi:translation initiation factor IF-2